MVAAALATSVTGATPLLLAALGETVAERSGVLNLGLEETMLLIFSTSFGFMNSVIRVASQFPDVRFEQATGYRTAANVAEYNLRFYEGRAVCRTVAGVLSKAGCAGFVGAYPIPEVVMGINTFTLAARRVNPAFRTKLIWINSWFDPGREADAARSLLDQGADMLADT